jgi:hypothetical protein
MVAMTMAKNDTEEARVPFLQTGHGGKDGVLKFDIER